MNPSAIDVAIFRPLALGVALTILTIVIHALALLTIIHFVRYETRLGRAGAGFWIDVSIIARTSLVALAAHLIEITCWAIAIRLCGEFPYFATAFYHSAMNYTSLGYGDLIMSPSWKLLGPLEAADGLLMFGISTAMIFTVIQRLVQSRFPDLRD
ncbi:MAG TPA: ion channel [Candidatus Binataceae bacterium]|nr:ion channel [Candidatus Binataceae bacterium]